MNKKEGKNDDVLVMRLRASEVLSPGVDVSEESDRMIGRPEGDRIPSYTRRRGWVNNTGIFPRLMSTTRIVSEN